MGYRKPDGKDKSKNTSTIMKQGSEAGRSGAAISNQPPTVDGTNAPDHTNDSSGARTADGSKVMDGQHCHQATGEEQDASDQQRQLTNQNPKNSQNSTSSGAGGVEEQSCGGDANLEVEEAKLQGGDGESGDHGEEDQESGEEDGSENSESDDDSTVASMIYETRVFDCDDPTPATQGFCNTEAQNLHERLNVLMSIHEHQHDDLIDRVDVLDERHDDLTDKVDVLENDLHDIEGEVQDMREEVEQVKGLGGQMEQLKQDHKSKIASFKSTLKELKHDQNARYQLALERGGQTKDPKKFVTIEKQLTIAVDEVRSKLDSLENLLTANGEAENKAEGETVDHAELAAALAQAQRMQEELESLRTANMALEEAQKSCYNNTTTVSNLGKRIKTLENDNARLRKQEAKKVVDASAEYRGLTDRLAALEEHGKTVESKLKEFQSLLKKKDDEITRLQAIERKLEDHATTTDEKITKLEGRQASVEYEVSQGTHRSTLRSNIVTLIVGATILATITFCCTTTTTTLGAKIDDRFGAVNDMVYNQSVTLYNHSHMIDSLSARVSKLDKKTREQDFEILTLNEIATVLMQKSDERDRKERAEEEAARLEAEKAKKEEERRRNSPWYLFGLF